MTLLDDWLAADLGDRLDRTDSLAQHTTEDVRLEIEGYTETISHKGWDAQLNAEPYDTWRIGLLASTSGDLDTKLGRVAGDEDCALRVAVDSDDLSFPFDPNRYRWTTAADDFDPDLRIRLGGELVEVSAIATTAAAFVAAGSLSSANNAAVTPALFAGATAKDLILVVARVRSVSAATLAITSGYTRLPIKNLSATSKIQAWAKVHSGSESNPTVTPTGGAAGDSVSAVTLGFRNMPTTLADLADLVVESASLTNSAAQNVAYPGVYPQTEGCVVLVIGGKDDDWTSVATLTGLAEAVDASTTTGNDQGIVVDYVIQTTPALVDAGSFVVTGGTSVVSHGVALALAGGFQTITVSNRSVNGVVKSHVAGTGIEVEDALVLGV
jgi:hypothetical protein